MNFVTDYRVEDYILRTRWEDFPQAVKDRALVCGVDLMMALILGSHGTQFQCGRRLAAHVEPGRLTIPGCRDTFSFLGAAIAMGHASNSFDIDDGHNMIKGHPGTSFIGGLLAAALERDIPYREYLTALVVGYDVAVREGLALQDHYRFLHSTGTYGAVATAAVAGRVLGMSREQLNTALSMAEFHAPLTPVMRAVEHPSMNKDGTPFGVMVGVLAVLDTLGGETACTHLLETEEYREAETLFVYVDCKHETETSDLIRRAWADGKSVAVPRVLGQEMKFFYIHSLETDLEDGYFGIREPYEKEPADEAADRPGSLMVMPGVAFDEARHRIGYGGGFYDRYLEAHPGLDTIALAFEFQVKEEVPFEPFDILPGKIVTEKRVIS